MILCDYHVALTHDTFQIDVSSYAFTFKFGSNNMLAHVFIPELERLFIKKLT